MSTDLTQSLRQHWQRLRPEEKAAFLPILKARLSTRLDSFQNPQLQSALETCVSARALVAPEQAKITELIALAKDPIVHEARQWQRDLIASQITRAADISEKRIAHFKSIKDFKAENERCAADTSYWFNYYAWTTDPRCSALVVQPLELFEFQERYIKWLDRITFVLQVSGVCEKARTMGATEVTLRWMLKHWRYRPNFLALPLSANEDLVDSKKDPGTLFEKLRFQLRMLPGWMLPKGFSLERDMPYMQLVNPENDSVLQGDAPTVNVGRQRRAQFILKDESAIWPSGGYQQHTSLSRASNTNVDVSSVQGKFNKFADLAHDNVTEKFEMDWREHPWLDDRWYNSLPFGVVGPAMTAEQIAQEIDRNYDASQPGRVLKNVKEEYCFITMEEMIAGFGTKGDLFRVGNPEDHRYRLPSDWNWGRVTDYGESAQREDDTHIWAYSLFARPAERWPLHDSLFFFISAPIMPIGATELEGFACYSEWERQLGLRGPSGFIREPSVNDMSHEALDPKQVLLSKCGDNWRIPDLDFDKGRRKLVFHFELTDKHLSNPFRSSLQGRTRIYFVSLNNEYQLARNARTGAHFVTPSTTQQGFKRLRAEIPAWHYPPEERGKPVPKMRPKSVFDDIITTVRYAVARWGVEAESLTHREQVIAAIPPQYQYSTLTEKTGGKGLTAEDQLSYLFQLDRAKRAIGPAVQEFDEWLSPISIDGEEEFNDNEG